jgi:hypothetical protein
MSEERLEEIEIPNPDANHILQPKTIMVRGLKISEREMIEKVENPPEGDRFAHKYRKEGEEWKPCLHCGDVIGIPLGDPLPSIDAVRETCSMYGKY